MNYDKDKIIKQYDTACDSCKQGWQAGLWPSWKIQQRVYEAMLGLGVEEGSTLLDVGCGQGDLVDFLKDAGMECRYTGLDISHKMIEKAKERYPCEKFLLQDVMDHEGSYDHVIATGTFNFKVDDQMVYTRVHLEKLFSLSKRWVTVFFLSKLLWDSYYDDLYYHDPAELVKECAGISKLFTVDHCHLPGLILVRLYR